MAQAPGANNPPWDPKAKLSPGTPSPTFPWKDVFAIPHVTTIGNCPAPTGSVPTKTNEHPPDHELSAAHKVNIHLAILVGGLTVGIIVITILTAVAGCIICTRQRRRKAEKVGAQLPDIDETLTYQSNKTAGSSRTTMSERRLKCQTGWQMKEFMHDGAHSPFSPADLSVNSPDKVEILARPRTLSDSFSDRSHNWDMPPPRVANYKRESISDTYSSEAPSYLPGDDARYIMPQMNAQSSTTALTEVSCAATIDSNSNSVCASRSLFSSHPSNTDTSPTLTPNLNSLINHKAFVLSMMADSNSLQPLQLGPVTQPHLPPPDPVLSSKNKRHSARSFSESIHTESTHESMYWINRQKS